MEVLAYLVYALLGFLLVSIIGSLLFDPIGSVLKIAQWAGYVAVGASLLRGDWGMCALSAIAVFFVWVLMGMNTARRQRKGVEPEDER